MLKANELVGQEQGEAGEEEYLIFVEYVLWVRKYLRCLYPYMCPGNHAAACAVSINIIPISQLREGVAEMGK